MGRMGLTNLRWEPTAAGKGGAECVAAARLIRAIQEAISLAVLQTKEDVCPQECSPITCPPLASHLCSLFKPRSPTLMGVRWGGEGTEFSLTEENVGGNRTYIKCQKQSLVAFFFNLLLTYKKRVVH